MLLSKLLQAVRAKMQTRHETGVDIPILYYHQIGMEEIPKFPSIYLNVKNFESQIQWLTRCGYQFLSLTELAEHIAKGTRPLKKGVAITFDDGYDGIYHNAFPILRKYGCPATVFIIASRLVRREDITSYPFLDLAQLREMIGCGVTVGSHSLSHKDLTSLCDEKNLRSEIADSKKMIEDLSGQRVQHFCYPYGRFTDRVADMVRLAGYTSGCSTIWGRWHTKNDLFKLKRVSIGCQQTLLKFIYRLEIVSRVNDPAAEPIHAVRE